MQTVTCGYVNRNVEAKDMATHDPVYRRIIGKTKLETVTSYFSMESIFDDRRCLSGARWCASGARFADEVRDVS